MSRRSRLRDLDTDLLVGAAVVVCSAVVLVSVGGSPLAWVVGIPFLLLWPGYALMAAILPEKPASQSAANTSESTVGRTADSPDRPTASNPATAGDRLTPPGWAARIGLSMVLSAVVVAVVGVIVDRIATISLGPVVGAIALVTIASFGVAAHRRQQLPVAARANPLDEALPELGLGSNRQHATLAVAILLLLGAVAVVGAAPPQGESYSESYLLAEGDDGELAAEAYPTTFVAGESEPVFVGVENHEHQPVTYTVVVVAETVDSDGTVSEEEQVDEFSVGLAHTESTVEERSITPTNTGDNVRLQFHVYKDTDPDEDTEADLTNQLWIEVVDGGVGE